MKRTTDDCIYGSAGRGKLPCESGMKCSAHSNPHACNFFMTARTNRRKHAVEWKHTVFFPQEMWNEDDKR